MSKDLFLIDTRCQINEAIEKALKEKGFGVQVATGFHGVPDEVLRQAAGFTAVCLFVNKRISEQQVMKINQLRIP